MSTLQRLTPATRTQRAERSEARLQFMHRANTERDATLAMVYRAASWAIDALRKNSARTGANKHAIYKRICAEVAQNMVEGPRTIGATGVQPA